MIILGIIIFAFLQILINLFSKTRHLTLNCGIFAQATKLPSSISTSEFNILGIYNVERGKNSCGVTFDGEIHHGVNQDKLYTDFIKNRNLKPKHFPTIIGHTRQASAGHAISLSNAHPFGFGELEHNRGYAFVGVHNGTLKNHKELAEKYNIELKEIDNYSTPVSTRDKIDSEVLLEILYKEQNFRVLSDYVGTAALVWSYTAAPNKIYLFSGASKEYDYMHSKVELERPLCVYLKSKNNMFVSSLLDSLQAIGADDKNSFQIENNVVYCVTDGNFKEAQTWKISREKIIQNQTYTNYKAPTNLNQNFSHCDERFYDNDGYNDSVNYNNARANKRNEYVQNFPSLRSENDLNIHNEKTIKDTSDYGSRIYFNKFRYYSNGHSINGIYTYIKNFGFKHISQTISNADKEIEWYKGLFFNAEKNSFNAVKTESTDFIPYKNGSKNPAYFYFVEGVMMKSAVDYSVMHHKKAILKAGEYLSFRELSYVSKHPVINITKGNDKTSAESKILFNGEPANTLNGGVCYLGGEKIYSIEKGILTKIVIREDVKFPFIKKEASVIQLPISFAKENPIIKKAINNILTIEETITVKENEIEKKEVLAQNDEAFLKSLHDSGSTEINNNKETDDFILELIGESLTEPVQEIIDLKKSLQDYRENEKAQECIVILEQIVDCISSLILK
jgi:predicted glutamine amidotransferase